LTDKTQPPLKRPKASRGRSATTRPHWFRPTLSTWVVGLIVGFLLLIATITSGVPGLLIFLGMAGFVTAFYAVITGRRSWASIPSRKTAGITLVASLVIVFTGGAAAGNTNRVEPTVAVQAAATSSAKPKPSANQKPSPSPTFSFSDEAPVDPSTVVAPSENASVVISDTTATDTTALALLATIPVKGKAPKTGYDRTGMFGTAWLDVDRNGCDTRNDILARDLTAVAKSGTCRVMTGNLVSPFTASPIEFVRGQDTSALVQIDHVVALSNSWQTGAQQLTQAQRISLANDPINLLAVDGRSNAQKGDGDTATWLPPNKAFRCGYVARQVSVKATYGLWVTQAEHDAMTRVLNACPSELALTSSFTPAPVPVVVPPPAPKPAPVPAPVPAPAPAPEVYYANCAAVRAAGAAPIYQGQPGYSTKLDRDKDGIACDT
jgi:hypothetical protein